MRHQLMRHWPVVLAILFLDATAIHVKAAEPLFLGRTREQWVEQLESNERRRRNHAAWAISQMAIEHADGQNAMLWLNELCLLTESGNPTSRYWGALGLGRLVQKLGTDDAARGKSLEALRAMLRDIAHGPRLAAAEALCRAGDAQRALPVLIAAMSDEQEAARIQAAGALEALGREARPAEAALRAASADPSQYVKRLAARALTKLDAASK